MRCQTTIQIIIIVSIFIMRPMATNADQDIVISVSPIIVLDSSPTAANKKTLLIQEYTKSNSYYFPSNSITDQNQRPMVDLDEYSLALGATIHINDNFNIGAACGMPLVNDENIQVEDLSIEAMISMQF